MVWAVETKNLSVAYGSRCVLEAFSFTAQVGEAVLLKGRSGCGKSTFLHAVCGLIPNSIPANMKGEVLVNGRNVREMSIAERAREVGIVLQNPETQLFCDSVEDEIAFGLENLCTPREETGYRLDEVLSALGLEELRFASPKVLSGGQKQLVVLAAVLALKPSILLLDEALSHLDCEGKDIMLTRLLALKREGCTLLMVDHDDDLVSITDRTVNLETA